MSAGSIWIDTQSRLWSRLCFGKQAVWWMMLILHCTHKMHRVPAGLARCAVLYLLTEMKHQSQIGDKAKLILLFHQPECLLGRVCPKPHMGDFLLLTLTHKSVFKATQNGVLLRIKQKYTHIITHYSFIRLYSILMTLLHKCMNFDIYASKPGMVKMLASISFFLFLHTDRLRPFLLMYSFTF